MDLDDLKEPGWQAPLVPRAASSRSLSNVHHSGSRAGARLRSLRVRVDLEHAKPPIWRRLDVLSDIGLDVFHQVLQSAFGWTDSHLHRFALGGSPFDENS